MGALRHQVPRKVLDWQKDLGDYMLKKYKKIDLNKIFILLKKWRREWSIQTFENNSMKIFKNCQHVWQFFPSSQLLKVNAFLFL